MEGVKMKIVVAVDESEESMHALSWCFTNLVSRNSSNATLVLLYVKPSPIIYSHFVFSADVIATMERYGDALVKSVMERAEAVYKNFNNDGKPFFSSSVSVSSLCVCLLNEDCTQLNVEKVVRTGEAKDVICNTVEKLKADTLVMGSHGYGFLKRVLLGSVSDYCAKQCFQI